jgi:citrate lyase beta subunit
MIHHQYNQDFPFIKEPVRFNKYSDKELLKYCLGATMYMPGTKDFTQVILQKKMPGLASMVMCFEDAIKVEEVDMAENNVLFFLSFISDALERGDVTDDDIPLIFCRVRSTEQFICFSEKLTKKHLRVLTGFNFPKFNTQNGEAYCSHLLRLNRQFGEILYGMPILEDREVAFKETRMKELLGIRDIVDKYAEIILHLRVGATDFSSYFGMRRDINYTVYDILPVQDCLLDIINVFGRDNNYVISGPVWEYFRVSKKMKYQNIPTLNVHESLLKRKPIFNDALDGLLREVILDKANGFVGKTVIHPTHVQCVNAMQAVIKEEYDDACQILGVSGGVMKSVTGNKMNEVGPHRRWAEKIYMKAKAYGVIENEASYVKLFSQEVTHDKRYQYAHS